MRVKQEPIIEWLTSNGPPSAAVQSIAGMSREHWAVSRAIFLQLAETQHMALGGLYQQHFGGVTMGD